MKHNPDDPMIGLRIGRLLVLKRVEGAKNRRRWECLCECGNIKVLSTSDLRGRRYSSCGCLRRESMTKHGHGGNGSNRSPTYNSWLAMRQRCGNPSHHKYPDYGGRGIKVHYLWQVSFLNFINDMGPRPHGMTLDRIDVNGNYEPGNCRWATPKEQEANKRQDDEETPF